MIPIPLDSIKPPPDRYGQKAELFFLYVLTVVKQKALHLKQSLCIGYSSPDGSLQIEFVFDNVDHHSELYACAYQID